MNEQREYFGRAMNLQSKAKEAARKGQPLAKYIPLSGAELGVFPQR